MDLRYRWVDRRISAPDETAWAQVPTLQKQNAADSAAFFMHHDVVQPCALMNSPIFGQMISRQRRPEKMP